MLVCFVNERQVLEGAALSSWRSFIPGTGSR